ncbi:MAG: ribonuclease E activity regulator RraA [Thermoleophilia bacterium]
MDWTTSDLSDAHGDVARPIACLRHFGGRVRFSGPVETVKCFEDNSRVKELANTPGEGRVLVVDGGGSLRYALVGDTIGAELIANGWVGVVVHGAVRDVRPLASLDLGVMALGVTPRRSARDGEGRSGAPVEIDGAWIAPGDVLYADEDGIVVLPPGS